MGYGFLGKQNCRRNFADGGFEAELPPGFGGGELTAGNAEYQIPKGIAALATNA